MQAQRKESGRSRGGSCEEGLERSFPGGPGVDAREPEGFFQFSVVTQWGQEHSQVRWLMLLQR